MYEWIFNIVPIVIGVGLGFYINLKGKTSICTPKKVMKAKDNLIKEEYVLKTHVEKELKKLEESLNKSDYIVAINSNPRKSYTYNGENKNEIINQIANELFDNVKKN